MARINSRPQSAGSSLRKVHAGVDAAWMARRRRLIRASLWWSVPLIVLAGVLAGVATRRVYFGVGFGILSFAALLDIAFSKPRAVTLAGHRASGEAATARAIKPLRFHGFIVLHDRRLPANAAPGLPPVDIEHLLIGPAGVFLLDSKNWMSGPQPQILGNELWVGRDKRDDALKRLSGDAKNLTDALRPRLPRDVIVEPVMVIHARDLPHMPRSMGGVTVLLPEQFSTVFGAMRQRLSPAEVSLLVQQLEAVLAPKTGDRMAPAD